MPTPLRILFAASEAAPFCKTGGLADVVGSLPKVLRQRGHDVRIMLPRYQDIDQSRYRMLPLLPEMKVSYGGEVLTGSVLRCSFPRTDMPVYFIDEPGLFGRKGLYGQGHSDFIDNDVRFAFFNMAILWTLKGLDWQPDIIHLNDWQTGLVPALLKHHPEVSIDPFYAEMRTVFSIHNLAYQGNFDKFLVPSIGLPWESFTPDGMEFYGMASFLKAGLAFSSKLVAVSPTYSREIQSEEHGAGMDGTLATRSADLHGILNGIDIEEWNPAADAHIAASYSAPSGDGKAACKAALQKRLGLRPEPGMPLVVMISRMISAKGFDLVKEALPELLALDAQFFILGSGDEEFETAIAEASAAHPGRFASMIGYDVPLSHQAVAGGDIFLMPSAFEPCGLTQMYSMRYGTVPVVRRTGGLSDSVSPLTGFLFEDYTPGAMVGALREALDAYAGGKLAWRKLMANGMEQDFSWDRSAAGYESLYRELSQSGNSL